MCSVLISFCTTPAEAELGAGGKSLSHTVPFQFQHHLLYSLSQGHSLCGSSLSHPWISTQRTIPVISQLQDDLPGKTTSVKEFWPLCLRCPTFFHLRLLLTA